MEDNELKCQMVRRMWTDGIVVGRQYADAETVVRKAALPTSDVGSAEDLLTGEMVDQADCPVHKVAGGIVTLSNDADAVREYLRRMCPEGTDLPWDLR